MLEPWGEDYWLEPGQSAEVFAEDPDCDRFEVVQEVDAISVFVDGTSRNVYVMRAGQRLVCGEGRGA